MQPGAELQTLFLAAKVRTKSKPPNKIKKKEESNHKKVEEQAKKQQERAKNRSETNKSPNSERTKARSELSPQSQLRAWSELRIGANPDPRANSELRVQSKKKRGVKTPQKIYASFCEMKPIVLKNPTPSFCGL